MPLSRKPWSQVEHVALGRAALSVSDDGKTNRFMLVSGIRSEFLMQLEKAKVSMMNLHGCPDWKADFKSVSFEESFATRMPPLTVPVTCHTSPVACPSPTRAYVYA